MRGQDLTTYLFRIRLKAATDAHFSFASFVQYNSEQRMIGVNARVRYNFAEGHDLWLVYDDGLSVDRFKTTPHLPASFGRALLAKYQYTFRS